MGLHQLIGGCTRPGFGLLRFEQQERTLTWPKQPLSI